MHYDFIKHIHKEVTFYFVVTNRQDIKLLVFQSRPCYEGSDVVWSAFSCADKWNFITTCILQS